MGMSYEQKMMFLSQVKPEMKDILLLKLLKGETIDLTKDADLFYQINADRMSIETFTERDKFKAAAEDMKRQKDVMHDPMYGKTKEKKMRWLGDIPAEIYFQHPGFAKEPDKAKRLKNIKKWLNTFPSFRAGDKQV